MIDALVSIADRLIQLKTYRDARLKELHQSLLKPLFDELLLVHNDYMQLFNRTEKMLPSMNEAVPTLFKVSSPRPPSALYFEDEAAAKRYRPEATGYSVSANVEGYFVVPAPDRGDPIWIGFEYMVNKDHYARALGVDASEAHAATRARTPPALREQLEQTRDFVSESRQAFEPVRVKLRALAAQSGSLDLSPQARDFVTAVVEYFPDGRFDTGRSSSAATSVLEAFEEHWHEVDDAYTARQIVFNVGYLLSTLRDDARLKWAVVCEAYAALQVAIVGRS